MGAQRWKCLWFVLVGSHSKSKTDYEDSMVMTSIRDNDDEHNHPHIHNEHGDD